MCFQKWEWQQKYTTGSPPLGVCNCGYTVLGTKVIMYGGYHGHGTCWHNSLHELDTTVLKWTELAPNEAEGAPIKKTCCGVVAHSNGGKKQLCVFGGYGPLNTSSHQTTAQYVESIRAPGRGYTNEFHCFSSGELLHYVVC